VAEVPNLEAEAAQRAGADSGSRNGDQSGADVQAAGWESIFEALTA
jgi:hypothetical protein